MPLSGGSTGFVVLHDHIGSAEQGHLNGAGVSCTLIAQAFCRPARAGQKTTLRQPYEHCIQTSDMPCQHLSASTRCIAASEAKAAMQGMAEGAHLHQLGQCISDWY